MGIPSPFQATLSSPINHSRFSLSGTLELPADVDDLLPVAACDLNQDDAGFFSDAAVFAFEGRDAKSFDRVETADCADSASDQYGQNGPGGAEDTDSTVSTSTRTRDSLSTKVSALPFSRMDVVMKNTFVDTGEVYDCNSGSEDGDGDLFGQRPRANSECTGLRLLAALAFDTECIERIKEELRSTAAAEACMHDDRLAEAAGGKYVRVVCRVQSVFGADATIGVQVMPCLTEEAVAAAQMSGEAKQMWCWMQADEYGNMMAVPCTDCPLEDEMPPSAAELVCAPSAPPEGSYVPPWDVGPYWCVRSPPTTLVLGNLPKSLTQEILLELLDRAEFSGFYDFVFLESDSKGECTCGSAFVNLTRHEYALALAAQFHQRTITQCDSEDVSACEVEWSSSVQGFNCLVDSYRDHPRNDDSVPEELRPQLFKVGWPSTIPKY